MNSIAAEVKIVHGVRLIRLQGTRDERAAQHGRLLAALSKKEKEALALYPLSTKNQSLIRNATPSMSGMRAILEKFYEAFVFKRFALLPKEYRNRLKPFQKAAQISEKRLWLALFQPDLLMFLASLAHEKSRNIFLGGMPGCTSGVLCDETAPTRPFLFLRNLDYPAASHWEKWPSVFYHEPSDGLSQKYVSIGSLGIHTPGLSGWNESGIAFSLHAHFSKRTASSGVPIFFLGEDLLERARTIEEAIRICSEFKPIGSWAINLASQKENKAVTVEMVNGSISVIPINDHLLCHSNGFESENFQEDELYFNGAFVEDVAARKKQITHDLNLAVKQSNPLQGAFNAIASHIDHTTGHTRVYGNTVSLITTIQSIVMDLRNQHIYLSARTETPTPLGPFIKLPLRWSEVIQKDFKEERFNPEPQHSKAFLKATHAFHEAYVSWQVREQGSKKGAELAHAFLIQATDAEPTDPHLWMQRGYFELMHQEPKTALHCFTQALRFPMSSHYRSVGQYFKAACLDLLGSRDEALQSYQALFSLPAKKLDPKLRKRVEKRLQKPFRASYCQKIVPDLQFVEPLEYP